MAKPEVTAIIPVFNDRPALEHAIPESLKALAAITENFEIIIAEDGSARRECRVRPGVRTTIRPGEVIALQYTSGSGKGPQQGNKKSTGLNCLLL